MNDQNNEKGATTHREETTHAMSKKRIVKNIAAVCTGVFTLFTAYDGPTMLQSTMNKEQGIGVASQAIMYGAFSISALLLPKYVIKKFGSKRTYMFSMMAYVPYIAANFYPHWDVEVPASILIGLGAALLWGAQATYLNDVSVMYAELCVSEKFHSIFTISRSKMGSYFDVMVQGTNNILFPRYSMPDFKISNDEHLKGKKYSLDSDERKVNFIEKYLTDVSVVAIPEASKSTKRKSIDFDSPLESRHFEESLKKKSVVHGETHNLVVRKVETITARVFGIHGMSYLVCHLSGNLLSYLILSTGELPRNYLNSTTSCGCGARYCNGKSTCFIDNVEEVSTDTRNLLSSVCVSLAIVAVLVVALFVDPLESKTEAEPFNLKFLMATYKLAKRTDLILLIPSSFYIGQVQGFYTGEFTKAYIGCAWGTYHVALVSICYGLFCALFASTSGWMVKVVGRECVFSLAALLNVASIALLLLWEPNSVNTHIFFVFGGMWGAYIGIIWSQLRAFYGVLFKAEEEAAFAAFHVWYALGFCLSFAYSNYFCTYIKIYVLLAISSLGYIGYFIVEKKFSKAKIKK
ncbi:protein unc-93 homolog A [Parasteatoda tepidariorum]|uniref:protein unc-93 homolog A n=1 Tax=Parasteatoda tepidariorum TaxID=114398 RepID=UPI001C72806F|nr:protein unc-93 homolog A [Parasteatoda tepidariorum]